jgi:hypothetical protein
MQVLTKTKTVQATAAGFSTYTSLTQVKRDCSHTAENRNSEARLDVPVKFDFFSINDVSEQIERIIFAIVTRTPPQDTSQIIAWKK